MHANGGLSFYNVRHLFSLFFFNVTSSRMTLAGIAFPSSLYLVTLSKLYSFANNLASLSIHTNPSGRWLTVVSCPFRIQYVQCVLNSPNCHSASCIFEISTLAFLFSLLLFPFSLMSFRCIRDPSLVFQALFSMMTFLSPPFFSLSVRRLSSIHYHAIFFGHNEMVLFLIIMLNFWKAFFWFCHMLSDLGVAFLILCKTLPER